MYFLAIFTLVLASIRACAAGSIPPVERAAIVAGLSDQELEARAFWPCFRCSVMCAEVAMGCGIVCLAAEVDAPLCGVSDRSFLTSISCRLQVSCLLDVEG